MNPELTNELFKKYSLFWKWSIIELISWLVDFMVNSNSNTKTYKYFLYIRILPTCRISIIYVRNCDHLLLTEIFFNLEIFHLNSKILSSKPIFMGKIVVKEMIIQMIFRKQCTGKKSSLLRNNYTFFLIWNFQQISEKNSRFFPKLIFSV